MLHPPLPAPASLAWHCVATHAEPGAHSASAVHRVRHPCSSHAYGEQSTIGGFAQPPAPSHIALAVNAAPAHVAAAQGVALPFAKPTQRDGSFAPSQASAAHTSAPPSSHFARVPWGRPLTPTHVPTEPATSQASHWPAHTV
jgi:hypothetical protein